MGHPSKFQRVSRLRFVTAVTSLTGGQPYFARCLAVPWTATLYIHFGGSCPLTEFCPVQIHFSDFTSKSWVLIYWQRYCTALQQLASAKLCDVVQVTELPNFSRRRHLYSAGRPSRWASAHILVVVENRNTVVVYFGPSATGAPCNAEPPNYRSRSRTAGCRRHLRASGLR